MRFRKHYLFLIPLAIVLSACNMGPKRIALDEIAKSNIQSDQLFLNTTEREIAMKHTAWFQDAPDPYSPMDSGAIVHQNLAYNPHQGLIGDMIVEGFKHSDAKFGSESLSPVRAALDDFNFVQYFDGQLKQKVATLPWLKVKKSQLVYNVKNSEQEIIAANKENTTLFIGTTYALNGYFNRLEVIAYVKLLQKTADPQKPQTLYANNFYFFHRINSKHDWKANQAIWLENDAALLKTKLRESAGLIAKTIASDMSIANPNPYAAVNNPVRLTAIEGGYVKGNLIKQDQGYAIVALTTGGDMNGFIYIVSDNELFK